MNVRTIIAVKDATYAVANRRRKNFSAPSWLANSTGWGAAPGIAEVRVPIPAKLNFKLRLYCDHDLRYINLFIPRFIYSSLQLWHSPSKGGLHIWRELVK